MLCLGAGCTGGSSAATTGSGGRLEYASSELPALGKPMHLDDARLVVAPPRNWRSAAADGDALARFYRYSADQLPVMRIAVEETGPSLLEPDDQQSLDAYVAAVATYAGGRLETGEQLQQAAEPHRLGGRVWVRYVRSAVQDGQPVDRQCLVTTVAGRTYRVELWVPAGKLLRYRDDAYAVAAGAEFRPSPSAGPKDAEASNHAEAVESPAANGKANDSAENRPHSLNRLSGR